MVIRSSSSQSVAPDDARFGKAEAPVREPTSTPGGVSSRQQDPTFAEHPVPRRPIRLALVSRGDPLTPYLHRSLRRRYPIAAEVDVELTGSRRALVAAATFRPGRSTWAEAYMKSNLGFRFRSELARQHLRGVSFDAAFQTHALFEADPSRSLMYIDCTYFQAASSWPAWTPHGGRSHRAWIEAETAAYRRALHLFAFTDVARDSLVNDYGVDPARVSTVGVGANFDTMPSLRSKPTGPPTIAFVGKDFTRKGGWQLLEAFAAIRDQIPEARLRIVGTQIPTAVPPGVEIVGLLKDRAMVEEVYRESHVFCLPSLFDPGPLVVLEAMALGVPCVLSGSASRHVKEIVDDGGGGLVVVAGDVEGLFQALLELLMSPDLAESIGTEARRRVAERFTWDAVVDRMAPVLESVVGA